MKSLGEVINYVWLTEDQRHSISPNRLRAALMKHQPSFRGNRQQDVHECLIFLLDGIHEDLNCISRDSKLETLCTDGTLPDIETANLAWSNYMKRNNSIIVKLLQGQLKSLLTCLSCKKEYIHFEPYMYLSLPIPIQQESPAKHTTNFYSSMNSYQYNMGISSPKSSKLSAESITLKKCLAEYVSRSVLQNFMRSTTA